jgi:hypothetical protein
MNVQERVRTKNFIKRFQLKRDLYFSKMAMEKRKEIIIKINMIGTRRGVKKSDDMIMILQEDTHLHSGPCLVFHRFPNLLEDRG